MKTNFLRKKIQDNYSNFWETFIFIITYYLLKLRFHLGYYKIRSKEFRNINQIQLNAIIFNRYTESNKHLI